MLPSTHPPTRMRVKIPILMKLVLDCSNLGGSCEMVLLGYDLYIHSRIHPRAYAFMDRFSRNWDQNVRIYIVPSVCLSVCLFIWPRTTPIFVDRFSWKKYQNFVNFSGKAVMWFSFKVRVTNAFTYASTRACVIKDRFSRNWIVPNFWGVAAE